jgi:uncharacterized YigZ family protein
VEEKIEFKTVSKISEGSYKEKGSKFIAYCIPFEVEESLKTELNNIKKIHPQARHICYAYKIGVTKIKTRANDDGEPNNSAGTPILGQINSFNITNVLIAVVRYFGGTKLGVGGLVTAYKTAAKEAILTNTITTEVLKSTFDIEFSYLHLQQIMRLLKANGAKIISIDQNNMDRNLLQFEIEHHIATTLMNQLKEHLIQPI